MHIPCVVFLRMNQKISLHFFFDDALSSRIINRIIAFHLRISFIIWRIGAISLREEIGSFLAYFQMNGCFAVSKRFAKTKR